MIYIHPNFIIMTLAFVLMSAGFYLWINND